MSAYFIFWSHSIAMHKNYVEIKCLLCFWHIWFILFATIRYEHLNFIASQLKFLNAVNTNVDEEVKNHMAKFTFQPLMHIKACITFAIVPNSTAKVLAFSKFDASAPWMHVIAHEPQVLVHRVTGPHHLGCGSCTH